MNRRRKLNICLRRRCRHVVTELLVTEQVYVEELRTIIEVIIVRTFNARCIAIVVFIHRVTC